MMMLAGIHRSRSRRWSYDEHLTCHLEQLSEPLTKLASAMFFNESNILCRNLGHSRLVSYEKRRQSIGEEPFEPFLARGHCELSVLHHDRR